MCVAGSCSSRHRTTKASNDSESTVFQTAAVVVYVTVFAFVVTAATIVIVVIVLDVLVVCSGCPGDVFYMFWGCFLDISGMCSTCFGNVFWMFSGGISQTKQHRVSHPCQVAVVSLLTREQKIHAHIQLVPQR